MTVAELELFSDTDSFWFIEKEITGRISYDAHRQIRANNNTCTDYNEIYI